MRFDFQDMLAGVPTALAFEKPNAVMESRLYAIKDACRRLAMGVTCYFIYSNYKSLGRAVLIARIYEVFPLLCPMCGGQMRLIAFITEGAQIKRILEHIGMDSQAPLQ